MRGKLGILELGNLHVAPVGLHIEGACVCVSLLLGLIACVPGLKAKWEKESGEGKVCINICLHFAQMADNVEVFVSPTGNPQADCEQFRESQNRTNPNREFCTK